MILPREWIQKHILAGHMLVCNRYVNDSSNKHGVIIVCLNPDKGRDDHEIAPNITRSSIGRLNRAMYNFSKLIPETGLH